MALFRPKFKDPKTGELKPSAVWWYKFYFRRPVHPRIFEDHVEDGTPLPEAFANHYKLAL